ncbi:MAG: cupin domain-containing protein [Oscillospiraceae bacterium]|jgi:uncharacterized cupin superfamily protein
MIKRKNELRKTENPHFKGGEGSIGMTTILTLEELGPAGRVYCVTEIPSGSSIGEHEHNGDAEVLYVLDGELDCIDNGKKDVLHPGDVMYTPSGSSHCVINNSGKTAHVIALVIYNV